MANRELVISENFEFNDTTQIKNLIYVVRNQPVMLDKDLAVLYQVETKRLNEAVRRNIVRFPDRFRFQVTEEENEILRSQIATSRLEDENGLHGGRRYLPYVFTEAGIAMLSSVLRSDVAVAVSVRIMDSFVEMRKYMANTTLIQERLNTMEIRQLNDKIETVNLIDKVDKRLDNVDERFDRVDERIDKVFDYIASREESEQKVFFDGQIYDAFSVIVELIQKADTNLVLIDNYVDVNTLNLLSKKKDNVAVIIYTQKNKMLTQADINTFNAQYPSLDVKYTKVFHDRFVIIDDTLGYHIGASLKDAGKKCFAISPIQEMSIIEDILDKLI